VKTALMKLDLQTKLQAMLWDMPEEKRLDTTNRILSNPVETFSNNNQLLLKSLNSLQWYELINLLGKQNLLLLLTDHTIQKLFPVQRRIYYTHARRLLSKYAVPSSGQGS
jgi:hypothetical protein